MRSSTHSPSVRSRLRCCAGDSATSKTTSPASPGLGQGLDFLNLAGADIVSGIGLVAPHGDVTGRHQSRRHHQLRQFLDGIGVVTPSLGNADQQRALGPSGALALNLEDGQESDSAVRLTGRAGTTVDIACL